MCDSVERLSRYGAAHRGRTGNPLDGNQTLCQIELTPQVIRAGYRIRTGDATLGRSCVANYTNPAGWGQCSDADAAPV